MRTKEQIKKFLEARNKKKVLEEECADNDNFGMVTYLSKTSSLPKNTLTVKTLREWLDVLPDNMPVVLSADKEGHQFSWCYQDSRPFCEYMVDFSGYSEPLLTSYESGENKHGVRSLVLFPMR